MSEELEQVIQQALDEVRAATSEAADAAVAELMNDGLSLGEAEDYIVLLLDAVLPFRSILPEPLGTMAEDASDEAIEAAVAAVRGIGLFDPEKIDQRADQAEERGHNRRAARRRRRADRIRARQERRSSGE